MNTNKPAVEEPFQAVERLAKLDGTVEERLLTPAEVAQEQEEFLRDFDPETMELRSVQEWRKKRQQEHSAWLLAQNQSGTKP